MKTSPPYKKIVITFFVLALFSAKNSEALNLQRNHPSTGYQFSFTETSQRPYLKEMGELLTELQYNYEMSPLTWYDAYGGSQTEWVKSVHSAHLSVSTTLWNSVSLSSDGTLHSFSTVNERRRFAYGDSRFSIKYLFPSYFFESAFQTYVLLPTGTRKDILSDNSVGYGIKGIIQKQFNSVLIAANLGYEAAPKATYMNLDYRKQISMGIGFRASLTQQIGINAETKITYTAAHAFDKGPSEIYIGPDFKAWNGGLAYLGVALNGMSNNNTANFEVIAGIKVFPLAKDDPSKLRIIHVPGCVNRNFVRRFSARRVSTAELRNIHKYPYFSSQDRRMALLQLGQGNRTFAGNHTTVNNGMIVFAIDVTGLPKRYSILDVATARLHMNVRQAGTDKESTHPELFCFLKESTCSGYVRLKSEWRKNIEMSFFKNRDTPNDYFSRQSITRPLAHQPGQFLFENDIELDLSRLVENVENYDALKILYGGTSETTTNNTLYLLVAGDTYVSHDKAWLNLNLRYNDCSSNTGPRVHE